MTGQRSLVVIFRISRDLVTTESKGLVWCTDDNPLRLVCMLEWTWSMGHLFRDVLYYSHVAERLPQNEVAESDRVYSFVHCYTLH